MHRDDKTIRKPILIYSAGRKNIGSRFKKEVERVIPDNVKDVCRTLKGFRQMLVDNLGAYKIVVLLCATQEEMRSFSLMRELFSESRLILIAPNHKAETIHQAHRLYPRFLSYADSHFENVAAVIQRSASLNTRPKTKTAIERSPFCEQN